MFLALVHEAACRTAAFPNKLPDPLGGGCGVLDIVRGNCDNATSNLQRPSTTSRIAWYIPDRYTVYGIPVYIIRYTVIPLYGYTVIQ